MTTVYLLENVPTRQSDNNFFPIPGSRLHTWVAGTTTPLATFTSATGATPLTNPVVADAQGFFPEIWVLGVAYDLEARKSDDTSVLWNRTNVNPGGIATALSAALASSANGSGADLVGGVGRVVNTIAALRALLISGTGKAFVLGYYASGDGGGGAYYYDAADTTSADDGGAVIVAADGGRWKLVYTDRVSVRQFGAKGDGTTVDTVSCQKAHDYAAKASDASVYGQAQPWIGRTPVVYYPMGLYVVGALTISGTCVIEGVGGSAYSQSKLVQSADNISMLTLTPGTDGQINATAIRGMTFKSGSASATDVSQIRVQSGITGSNSIYIDNCVFEDAEMWAIDIPQGDDIRITNCTFDVMGFNAIRLGSASGLVSNFRITGNDFFQIPQRTISLVNTTAGVIANNTSQSCGSSNANASFVASVSSTGCSLVEVVNNTVRDLQGPFAVITTSASTVTISNNVVAFNATVSPTFISVTGGGSLAALVVQGNNVSTPANSSATSPLITSTGSGVIVSNISGNVFVSAGGTTPVSAISLPDTRSTGNYVTNNLSLGLSADVINDPPRNHARNTLASGTLSVGSVTAGATVTRDVTLASASLNQFVSVAWVGVSPLPNGVVFRADVPAAGTVRLYYTNLTGGSLTVVNHQVYVETRETF